MQVHHAWFLEWVGAPESTCLLGCAPSEWIRSLTRLQILNAARKLQRDAYLMTSYRNVLDQYALSLHGTVSDMLELVVGHHDFPSAAMETAAPVSRFRRASTHMEAMGLWRPPHGPGWPALDFVHQGPMASGCPTGMP